MIGGDRTEMRPTQKRTQTKDLAIKSMKKAKTKGLSGAPPSKIHKSNNWVKV